MTIAKTTDAKLSLNTLGFVDFTLDSSGDIATEDFFDTSIVMSLFAEKRASNSEVPESRRRRGWIGNESTPNFENGSKIWLFEQSKLTRTTLNEIETAAQDGLKWLIEDGIAVSTESVASITGISSILLAITIRRTNSKVEKRFFELWDNSGITNL